jgi:hypothetical protein
MTLTVVNTKQQKTIIDSHKNHPEIFIWKDKKSRMGHSDDNPVKISLIYELVGKTIKEMPNFNYSVGTYYDVYLREDFISGEIDFGDDFVFLTIAFSNHLIDISFPCIKDLFYLRNTEMLKGRLISELLIEGYDDIVRQVIQDENISKGFYFKVSSPVRNISINMNLRYPKAEELIQRYLDTINNQFQAPSLFKSRFIKKGGQKPFKEFMKDLRNLFGEYPGLS